LFSAGLWSGRGCKRPGAGCPAVGRLAPPGAQRQPGALVARVQRERLGQDSQRHLRIGGSLGLLQESLDPLVAICRCNVFSHECKLLSRF
jgi:hypothetical protein